VLARRLVGSLSNDMSSNESRAGKTAGTDPTGGQRAVECQDEACGYTDSFGGRQADGQALNDAMHHAGETGHEVVAEQSRRNIRVHGAAPEEVDADA